MSLLKNPSELPPTLTFSGMIYGQPGIGKSTLSLSAPNPVMIDADNGMKRVEPRFRVPSLPMHKYSDVLTLMNGSELDPYQTIVIDTMGKFLDRIGDYVMQENPKNRQGDGSLSQKGWGAVKQEFQKFLRLAQGKGKNLVFVAHEREEKDGDAKKLRPDISGSSGKDIVKELDFMGYMEKRAGKCVISFNPDESFYAKNSLKLPQYMEVPNPDVTGVNDFIIKNIVERSVERMSEEIAQNEKYDAVIAGGAAKIEAVKDAKTADEALKFIADTPAMWDSQRVLKHKLNEKVKAVGLVYDKDKKAFKKDTAAKAAAQPDAAQETASAPAEQPKEEAAA